MDFIDWFTHDLPPGPRCLKVAWVINLQKVGCPFYIMFLMYYFNNYSEAMCVYFVMHGSYGLLWYLKHMNFPDASFEDYITVTCASIVWAFFLGPYLVFGYLIASGECYLTKDSTDLSLPAEPSKLRKYWCLFCYIFGICLTLTSDAQKTMILKHVTKRPFLINDGLFSRTRNPNYLGEIMLYSSFAMITGHWLSYAVITFAFSTVFVLRMWQKEVSLRKKPGFEEYSQRSNLLLPKVMGLNDWQMAIIIGSAIWYGYTNA